MSTTREVSRRTMIRGAATLPAVPSRSSAAAAPVAALPVDSRPLARRAVLGRLAVALGMGAAANVTAVAVTRSAPIAIPPASTGGESIEIAAKLIKANLREDAAGDVLNSAEEAMAAWQKRNPLPAMREIKEKNGTVKYEAWFKQLVEATDPSEKERLKRLDPNADLKAAMNEVEIRRAAWCKQRATAEAECGFHGAEAQWNAAASEVAKLCDTLAETSMTTLDGLKIKCRAAVLNCNDDIAWSVVHDLLAMCVPPVAPASEVL